MSTITSIDHGMPAYGAPEILTFTTSGSVASAAAIPHGTTVELYATEACYVAFGATAPTAASTSHKLPADWPIQRTMHGDTFIGVRGAVAGGTLTISILRVGGGK